MHMHVLTHPNTPHIYEDVCIYTQIITPKMEKHKERLRDSFSKCVPNSFTRTAVAEVYSTLFDKMVNLRKKDMEKSWERVQGKIRQIGHIEST